MSDPRQTAMRDNFGRPYIGHDPGAPDGDQTNFVLVSASESGQEMRIIADSAKWWAQPDMGTLVADLAAIAPDRGNWHDVFGRPLAWFSREVKRARRRVRMARKKRRGWA